jgi:hypothetical protein
MRHSILDDVPEVVRDKVQRALRNVKRLSEESRSRPDQEHDAAMAPDQETLDELRRICARKGIVADAVIALHIKDN